MSREILEMASSEGTRGNFEDYSMDPRRTSSGSSEILRSNSEGASRIHSLSFKNGKGNGSPGLAEFERRRCKRTTWVTIMLGPSLLLKSEINLWHLMARKCHK